MRRPHSRRLSTLIAAWLVALIALPFTAPFKTWDLAAPAEEAPLNDVLSSDKVAKDAATIAPSDQIVLLVASSRHQATRLRRDVDLPRLLSTVLRL